MTESAHVNFPSQVVSDLEKLSDSYGLEVARAIEQEWFQGNNAGKYLDTVSAFHKLRLYARGEQPIQKYKDELSINGDLSYLNLDWKPVPIIPKFVDIVVNGMASRSYNIKCHSQDQYGVNKRTEYMESLLRDMKAKAFNDKAAALFNANLNENKQGDIPGSEEELQLHMQLNYKQGVEIANEQAIDVLLKGNNYDLVRRRLIEDLTVLGIGCVKTSFNFSEGVSVEYVDPANVVYSHTESPHFEDIYYVGEVKTIPINEVVRQFPNLTASDLEDINSSAKRPSGRYTYKEVNDKNKVQILYFNYKTYMNDVYKIKETAAGTEKAIRKDENFDPPEDKQIGFSKESRIVEVVFDGAIVLGTDKLLKWEMAKNMIRDKSDFNKVKMNYSIVAPRMYKGKIESLVRRITGFADMIQLTHLKLQQIMARMVPDGVYLDADGLAEVDLGNGTNYNPQEALNMFFQTGSVIGRSYTGDGDINAGKVPIQEITSGSGGNKIQALIGNYNYYMQMIRDTTGLNEARDGSMPDKNALVGVQKLAAANSNTATRHILQAGLFLTAETAEKLSLRISDVLEYSPTKEAFIQTIGSSNVSVLDELKELYLYDFGIFIELQPDEEEKALLENNIQVALAQQSINLEDAIDIREVKNLKTANQLLKIRRKKKQQSDQLVAQQNIEAQANANAQAQQTAAAAEVQKNQAITQSSIQLEQVKAQLESNKILQEVSAKKELMQLEFQMNMQLKTAEVEGSKSREKEKEDRKDERTRIQATQQSELIDQRNSGKPAKTFESSGNDILGGGFDLGGFEPR